MFDPVDLFSTFFGEWKVDFLHYFSLSPKKPTAPPPLQGTAPLAGSWSPASPSSPKHAKFWRRQQPPGNLGTRATLVPGTRVLGTGLSRFLLPDAEGLVCARILSKYGYWRCSDTGWILAGPFSRVYGMRRCRYLLSMALFHELLVCTSMRNVLIVCEFAFVKCGPLCVTMGLPC